MKITISQIQNILSISKIALSNFILDKLSDDTSNIFYVDKVRGNQNILLIKDPWEENDYDHDNPKNRLYIVQDKKAKIKKSMIEFIKSYRQKDQIPENTQRFIQEFNQIPKDNNGVYSLKSEENIKLFIDYILAVKEACIYRKNNKKPEIESQTKNKIKKLVDSENRINIFIDSCDNKNYDIVKRHESQRLFCIIKRLAIRNNDYGRAQSYEDKIYADETREFRNKAILVQSDEFENNDRFLSTKYVTKEVYDYGHMISQEEFALHAEHPWAKSNSISEIKDNVIYALLDPKISEERIIHYIGESLELIKEMVLCFRFQENPGEKRLEKIEQFKNKIWEKTGSFVSVSKINHHNEANGFERYLDVTLLDKNGNIIDKEKISRDIKDNQKKLRIELHGIPNVKLK